ncbi:Trypsin domain containing protein, variant 2 [Balamuthia mandrillaris]
MAGYSGWELGWSGVVAAAPTLPPPPPSFIGGSTAVEKGRTSNFQAKGGKGNGGAEGGEHDYEAKVPPPWADAGNLGSIALIQLSSYQRSSSPSPTSSIAAATASHHHHPDLPNGWISAKALSRGESMMTIGSPYGLLSPNAFLNCVSAGALSNKVTCTDVTGGLVVPLLLTDTRCLPGMEGGAVIDPCGQWVGMLTPPLYRRDGSPVELNIILTADVLLPIVHCYFSPSFLRTKGTSSVTNSLPPENVSHADVASYALPRPTSTSYTGNDRTTNSNYNALQQSQRKKVLPVAIRRAHWSLVLVTVGNTWASGIIISNNGYVLTNAHVIRPYLNISHPTEGSSEQQVTPQLRAGAQLRVRVDFPLLSSSSASSSFPFYPADVVFVSPTANPDIALLKLSLPDDIASLPAVALCKTAPKEGQKAFILGHAIFGPSTELRASCTKGIVSKVVYVKQRPVLIQTSAAVHSGNSGGMLLDIKGKLVGVVTCNMKQRTDDTTITIPRLNFSIPIPELLPLFRYVQSSDKDKWKTLISEFNKKREADEEIETDRLWGLSERPLDPAQPFDISKGGSKFLQFMNQLNTPHSSSPATEDDQVRAKL